MNTNEGDAEQAGPRASRSESPAGHQARGGAGADSRRTESVFESRSVEGDAESSRLRGDAGCLPARRLAGPVRRSPWLAVWLKIIVSFAVAAVALSVVVPRLPGSGDSEVPPIGLLLASGSIVACLTTVAIYLILRFDLGLDLSVALLTIGYCLLVVAVKFVIAPSGLYEINNTSNPPVSEIDLDDSFGALVTAALVFCLYLIGYRLVYRRYRRRIAHLLAKPRVGWRRRWVVILFTLLILAAAAGLSGAWIVLAFSVPGAFDYLEFVFSSSLSLLVAVILAGAIALASLTFRDVAEKARLVGDAALLVNAFWVGLAFLALYHALWVVYILVLTAIWPLKVVTPK